MLQLFLIFTLLLATVNLAFSFLKKDHIPTAPAGIFQLIEKRAGRVSCWGVIVRLGDSRFKKSIDAEHIEIYEAKHGHDLKEIMTWSVQQAGKRLIIKFKSGKGDFGTGNRVEIRIDRTAFVEPIASANKYFEWSIGTDVL